ncbi:DUF488 domain-containing protein [Pseudactinotalea sp. HY158]|uniref:DUF488 domain-containing protein n=1 Tax=Pseudactinotalea sp. HY158 TaxID=2654547 RepID=UPI00129C9E5F|nr:DUF488 family protein [Pseudactinotalea sp. HY158]QGH68551.1 DUF488 family protein [Pseudactinotalea sp. HY158]
MTAIELVRVYDARRGNPAHASVEAALTGPEHPSVFLVDRLWPRGVAKADLPHDVWLKEAGPSTELRRWFGHDPERFAEFAERYRGELEENREQAAPLLEAAARGEVMLLFSAKDEEHNQAVVLRGWIEDRR